jgi:hypothetical protein
VSKGIEGQQSHALLKIAGVSWVRFAPVKFALIRPALIRLTPLKFALDLITWPPTFLPNKPINYSSNVGRDPAQKRFPTGMLNKNPSAVIGTTVSIWSTCLGVSENNDLICRDENSFFFFIAMGVEFLLIHKNEL